MHWPAPSCRTTTTAAGKACGSISTRPGPEAPCRERRHSLHPFSPTSSPTERTEETFMHSNDPTVDPGLQSWVASANLPGADFPLQNLPYGRFLAEGDPA